MTEVVVVATARTPIGTSYKGTLATTDAYHLGRVVVSEVLHRSGVASDQVDDIVLGESMQGGGDVARHAAVQLGIENVPGAATNRWCASGMNAVHNAAANIKSGMDTVVIAGGTECLSTAPATTKPDETGTPQQWIPPSHPDTEQAPNLNMAITVGENTARIAGVTREEADHWAFHSHQRAVAGIDEGKFNEEIIAVEVPDGAGGIRVFDTDEHPRRTTTLDKLAELPVLNPMYENAIVTAGNSSGLNDAAAALMLTTREYADDNDLEALAVVHSWASVGVDPVETGLAPTKAIPKALDRAGVGKDQIELVEINEAFASMAVASSRLLGFDHEIVNVLGSGCSLGHPIACSGARMLVTQINEMQRRGATWGVASMCAGGGMGSATVIEVLNRR